jgi:probable F420-dependent oxidoreductase
MIRLMSGIAVSVQAAPADLPSWLALARRLEAAGFRGLLMGDHPGSGAAPMPALGAAAAVTQTLELGTCVIQAGVREPAHVAADAATLDLLAPGRVVGIGAGHTPREWSDIGRPRPSSRDRAERLAEFAGAVAVLLRGEIADLDGRHLTVAGAQLDDLPAGDRIKLTIGGGHPLILRAAARHADVVSLSGLGRTLPDGHHHEVRWAPADLQRQLQLVRDEARTAGNSPAIEVLVQSVQVTDDRTAAIEELAARIPGASAEDISRTPFVLIGSHAQLAGQLLAQARDLGITRYVVREPAVPDLERVLALIPAT